MATQSITTDLQTINDAEPGTLTSWSALGGGASGLAEETDYAIQGTTSISKQVKLETKGQVANFGSGITLGARDHIYTWLYATTPGATDLRANGGLRVTAGTSTTARKEFFVNGRDFYRYGGWICYPVQYTQTADATVGSPGAAPQYFGGVMSNYVTVKGINFGVDVLRYGTGIDATGGGTPDPDLTFSAIATVNDSNTNAWGICQGTDSGVSLQGELRIGADNGTTPTTFTDVDAVVAKPNNNPSDVNQKTATDFTGIKLAGTNTTASFTGCSFISLDTVDKGYIDCDTATNPVGSATFDGCTFLDWGGIGGSGNTLFDGCSFKNCAQMILNGSTVTGGTYINCAPVDVGTNLGLISNTNFESGGSGHAITTSANSGSLSFVGNKFTGYTTGANAALNFTATTGSVTVNVSGGGDVPTFQTAGVAVTIASASTLTFTGVKDGSEIRIYEAGTTTELDGIESVTGGTFASSISVGSVDAVVFALGYLEVRYYSLTTTADLSVPVQQTIDRQYENPAGIPGGGTGALTIDVGTATALTMEGSLDWYADDSAMSADGWTVDGGLSGLDQSEAAIFLPAAYRDIPVLGNDGLGATSVPNTRADGQVVVSGNCLLYWLDGAATNGITCNFLGGLDTVVRRGGYKDGVSYANRTWFVVRLDYYLFAAPTAGNSFEFWIATDGSLRWVVGNEQGSGIVPSVRNTKESGIFRLTGAPGGTPASVAAASVEITELGIHSDWPDGLTGAGAYYMDCLVD